jgi:hypothetical protein
MAEENRTQRDFFISYASPDSDWAEWIAWQLEEAHYSTVLQAWDFAAGSNFVLEMDRAATEAKKTIAVISQSYIDSLFVKPEWTVAFARDPMGVARSLLPIRVKPCQLEGMLAQVVYIDLLNIDERGARRRLLEKVGGGRTKPLASPVFPGNPEARIPRPFPGNQAPEIHALHHVFFSRGFVCAKLTANGLLDLEMPQNPYGDALDPSEHGVLGEHLEVALALWLPSAEYIRSPMQRLTPVSAICTLDPERVLRRAREVSPNFAEIIAEKMPRDMRNDVREEVIAAMGYGLRGSFVAAVTIPSIVLGVGKKDAKMGYQTILDLFLFPLLETHCQIGFRKFHICFPSLDDITCRASIIKVAKRMVAALCSARRGTAGTVDFASSSTSRLAFINMARFLTWMAGAYYNHRNEKWLLLFRDQLESEGGD